MNIELHSISISELTNGYRDDNEGGVVGYGNRLDIRPPYQREFIYDEKKRDLVIDSVMKGYPLNAMYWIANEDGRFEVLDGQQRTISICQYATGKFHWNKSTLGNLTKEEQQKFYDYKLTVYFCSGNENEKIDWFRRINVAGMELEEQEIRNAIYSGLFVTEAKKIFSKSEGKGVIRGRNYLKGAPLRQAYLETVLDWKSNKDGYKNIEIYMSDHRNDESEADKLLAYFESVVMWIQSIFDTSLLKNEMCGLPWGRWFNDEKIRNKYTFEDRLVIADRIEELIEDDDVTSPRGIFEYILTGEEKHLNLRAFSPKLKKQKWIEQDNKCIRCGHHSKEIKDFEADHITPWSEGGKTVLENCQILCKTCNRKKSNS